MQMNTTGMAEQLKCEYGAISSALAAGTGDNTEVNGAALDVNGNYGSLKVMIAYTTTLTEDKTLTMKTANLQTADDSSFTENAADFGDAITADTVLATGATSGSTSTGLIEMDFDLSAARRYVRVQYKPDLSHSGTDTATFSASYILAGAKEQPIGSKSN